MRKDDCLAAKCANLGSADIENVAKRGNIRKRDVGIPAHQAVTKPCPVQKERDRMAAAERGELLQFSKRIKRSVLGGMRNINHPREDHMLVRAVGIEGVNQSFHILCRELAVISRNGQHLVPRRLNGACLVGADVPSGGRDHALVALEHRVDDDAVGLRSAHQKANVGILPSAGHADLLARLLGVGVLSVSRAGLHVRAQESLKDLGMRTDVIITFKR